jgi:hypothetical protein
MLVAWIVGVVLRLSVDRYFLWRWFSRDCYIDLSRVVN